LNNADFENIDVAIEFTKPELAVQHITFCAENKIPIVVGTTAWLEDLPKVEEIITKNDSTLLHASNFSIGVNIFFEVNKKLAQLMQGHAEYKAEIEEIHHLQKADAPSGTAITLADGILENNTDYLSWVLGKDQVPYTNNNQLGIAAYRQPDVPGTHEVTYKSEIDTIKIYHEAHNRKGFAMGAVIAAEYVLGKKGLFSMKDVLNF
jgi:4-hydroxy-tetrahydrodipicolinate reductase